MAVGKTRITEVISCIDMMHMMKATCGVRLWRFRA